ncbi:MAG TPA: hypothetical protein VH330_07310 [Candidatus Udaeobacter sp.]|jgi:hypothetical protein
MDELVDKVQPFVTLEADNNAVKKEASDKFRTPLQQMRFSPR